MRGLTAQRIWQDLCEDQGFGHGYASSQHFVRELRRRRPEVSDMMEHPPGKEGEVDKIDRLLAAAVGDPREALYVVAVLLGVREGELLGLPWPNVDLARRQLRIAGTSSRTLDGDHVVTLPKTSASHRRLMLPLLAVDALARTPRLGDLVWPGDDGRLMPSSTFTHRWEALRRRAGIRPVNFHALRHTAATQALEDGQPAHVVAAMLGHASVGTTLRIYAHVTQVSTEALVASIAARHGRRLRVLPGALRGTNGGTDPEIVAHKGLQWCRERESNPYERTLTAP